MYGSHIGSLRVWAQTTPSARQIGGDLFNRTGDQGDVWRVAHITLPRAIRAEVRYAPYEGTSLCHHVTVSTVSPCHSVHRVTMSQWTLCHHVTVDTVSPCHSGHCVTMSQVTLCHNVTVDTVSLCYSVHCVTMSQWTLYHNVTVSTESPCHSVH